MLRMGFLSSAIAALSLSVASGEGSKPMSVHDFEMKSIDGKTVKLSSYKGNVLLLVNVASR